jgi:hypothetical protein
MQPFIQVDKPAPTTNFMLIRISKKVLVLFKHQNLQDWSILLFRSREVAVYFEFARFFTEEN